MSNTIVDRKLWLTADGERVVADGDPQAAILFATPGDEVTDEDAKRYGIKAAKPAANTQAVAKPAANKQAVAPANKGLGPLLPKVVADT